MADQKEPRHKRLYKNSPKLERGEDGNMKATKPNDKRGEKPSEGEKKADNEQSGTDGKTDVEPKHAARAQELKDMHKRHQVEMEAIYKRHEKEDAKEYDNPNGDSNEKPVAGRKEIKEVEDGKEITQ